MKLISFLSDWFKGPGLANLAIGGWVSALFSPYGYLAMLIASACIIFLTLLWEYYVSRSLRASAVVMCGLGCILSFLSQPLLQSFLVKYIEEFYLQ